jgi:hypothetical protein
MVIIAAISAYDISRIGAKRKMLLLIAVPLLVTGTFWSPGLTHLPAIAFSLLACALFLRRKMVSAGGCIGLVVFTKLIMFPLPAIFCFIHEVIMWDRQKSRRHFIRMAIGFTSVSIIMFITLLTRHELSAYLKAQLNNVLYANNVLVDNSSLGHSVASHLRLMFLDSPEKRLLLFSIIASISFSGYIATQTRVDKKNKAFLISTLATYLISLIVLGLTGIWDHHLQLIYFSQILMLIYIVMSLSSKAFETFFFSLVIVVSAILLSGTSYLGHYVESPRIIMTKISSLTQESPETAAFRTMYPYGTRFARLGENTNVIPHGAANDKLLCPDFAQYPFYSPERLSNILACIKTSPTLVVDDSFSRYEKAPNGWPSESQKQLMIENWNDFVTAGEKIISTQYSCKRLGTTRICESVAK